MIGPNTRDINKLIATDTAANNAAWFLANNPLWTNDDVINYLSTTVLSDSEFMALNRVNLQQFFAYNSHTQNLKTLIQQNRIDYVDGV